MSSRTTTKYIRQTPTLETQYISATKVAHIHVHACISRQMAPPIMKVKCIIMMFVSGYTWPATTSSPEENVPVHILQCS